jgi:hypothetical protein
VAAPSRAQLQHPAQQAAKRSSCRRHPFRCAAGKKGGQARGEGWAGGREADGGRMGRRGHGAHAQRRHMDQCQGQILWDVLLPKCRLRAYSDAHLSCVEKNCTSRRTSAGSSGSSAGLRPPPPCASAAQRCSTSSQAACGPEGRAVGFTDQIAQQPKDTSSPSPLRHPELFCFSPLPPTPHAIPTHPPNQPDHTTHTYKSGFLLCTWALPHPFTYMDTFSPP